MTHDEALAILGPHPADCPDVPAYESSPHHRCLWVESVDQLLRDEARARRLFERWGDLLRRLAS